MMVAGRCLYHQPIVPRGVCKGAGFRRTPVAVPLCDVSYRQKMCLPMRLICGRLQIQAEVAVAGLK